MNDRPRHVILAALILGLAAMFTSAIAWRFGDHPLVLRKNIPASMPPAAAPAQQSNEEGIAALMRQMKSNPDNLDAMLELSRIFSERGDAEGALELLRRAEEASPSDPRPKHLAGVQLAAMSRWPEAAESLRKAIAARDDASARFSLGVICRYHLNLPSEARTHWEAAARICTDKELEKLIHAEISKLN